MMPRGGIGTTSAILGSIERKTDMATDTVSMSRDILRTPGLENAARGIADGPQPRFYSLSFDGMAVNIESTALKVTDAMTRFSLDDQKKIFKVLLEKLPKSGKSLILREDVLANDFAYVTRRDDYLGGVVNLLFSR